VADDEIHAVGIWAATHAATVPVFGRRPAAGPAEGSAPAGGKLVMPPSEVTPAFTIPPAPANESDVETYAEGMSAITTAAGRTFLATTDGVVQLWDLDDGRHLRTLGERAAYDAAWAQTSDGRLLLATACMQGRVEIWDPDTGERLRTLTGHAPRSNVMSVAWAHTGKDELLLATGSSDRTTRIWDPDTGACLHTLSEHGGTVNSVAWARTADGRLLLATGSFDDEARIWDAGTGECLRRLEGHEDDINSVAWALAPDGRLLLATGADDDTTRIWDSSTGQALHTLTGASVDCVAWAKTADGLLVLAARGRDGVTRIWDPLNSAELASVPSASADYRRSAAWVRDRAGNLLLLLSRPDGSPAGHGDSPGPVRAWLVETAPAGAKQPVIKPEDGRSTGIPAGTIARLLRLGAGGLWPPLGLVADLVTLTAPGQQHRPTAPSRAISAGLTLCEPRLAVLADEPGIALLRELAAGEPRWTGDARSAFAALLCTSLDLPPEYCPPPAADPAGLPVALEEALRHRADSAPGRPPWQPPVAGLRTALAGITCQAIALLAILGPAACAGNPLLPARLAHRIPQLPALSSGELRLLTAITGRTGRENFIAGTRTWAPGTVGVSRNGQLSRLLPTQLALPRDIMAMRLAEDQLLYRQHRAAERPAPEPVTIILDTTPPTFGPAGNALRLAVHLITTTLWAYGRYPVLISLDDPRASAELRDPADLIRIWVSGTLDPPTASLAIARRTAIGLRQTALLCTHFQTARDTGYRPGPASRLLTAHQPPEQGAEPSSPWHAHLSPGPTAAGLTAAIGRLLASRPYDGD